MVVETGILVVWLKSKSTYILTVRHGVHAFFGLGAVCGWVKGKGRPPLVGIYWGTLKNKQSNICYLYI